MRNYLFLYVTLAFLLILSACSGETAEGANASNGQNNGDISKTVNLGEPFLVEYKSSRDDEPQKFNLTIDYQLAENKSTSERANEESHFVQLDLVLENIGEVTVSESSLVAASFSFYDENGVEISQFPLLNANEDDLFKRGAVRPGGRNEGRMYLTISKGEIPATIIYSPNWLLGGDEYIIELQSF